MGIYDRDYYREEPRRSLMGNWSAVNFLIVVNVAIFVIDQFTDQIGRGEHWLDAHMALLPDLITHPWRFWTLLTYGFAHDPSNIIHVGGNMFVLWVFGVDVERLYGRERFMRLYLSLVVSSGLAWLVIQQLSKSNIGVIGASGAIMGIMAIYILNYPHRTFLFYFVIPVPAWLLGILYVGADFYGVMSPGDNVAHGAHIAGALFGLLYVRTGWHLFSFLPTRWAKWAKFGGPKLRLRSDDDEPRTQREVQMRVDEILEKISREGESSLTPDERRELEDLSRRFRNRR
jgi:membrane associated rhomboid family serine protease